MLAFQTVFGGFTKVCTARFSMQSLGQEGRESGRRTVPSRSFSYSVRGVPVGRLTCRGSKLLLRATSAKDSVSVLLPVIHVGQDLP